MTNNPDDFEFENFEAEPQKASFKKNLAEAWQTKPAFKFMAIMGVVAIALILVFGVFASPKPPVQSRIGTAPSLDEPPGSKASPFLIQQNQQANEQRTQDALQQGGSVMPTPIGQSIEPIEPNSNKSDDPLMEFRTETERLRNELKQQQEQNTQQMNVIQQQVQAPPPPPQAPKQFDPGLANAMQQQLSQLMSAWAVKGVAVVQGAAPVEIASTNTAVDTALNSPANVNAADADYTQTSVVATKKTKPLLMAGTVSYAQMLMEANSDVPGPIMAQILSGPLAGARAIGTFSVQDDYLVIRFNTAIKKNKEYSIDAIALDPNTTLGALVTDVDHRYFSRVILPAAGAFVSSFGSALSQPQTTTVIDSTGSAFQSQAKQGTTDALYAGLGSVGSTVAGFLNNEASKIQPLVKVAVGTPFGLFFLSTICNGVEACSADMEQLDTQRRNTIDASFVSSQNRAAASNSSGAGVGSTSLPNLQNNGLGNSLGSVGTNLSNNLGSYTTQNKSGTANTYNPTIGYGSR